MVCKKMGRSSAYDLLSGLCCDVVAIAVEPEAFDVVASEIGT